MSTYSEVKSKQFDSDSLTIEDHTALVLKAMENVEPILSKMRALKGAALSRDIGIAEPLKAFSASSISTKRMRRVATHAVKLCEEMKLDLGNPPKEAKDVLVRVDEIFGETMDFDEIKCQLQSLILEHDEGSALRTGLQTGLDMLDDGSDTIYSPSNRYFRNLAAMANEGVVQNSDSSSGATIVFSKKKSAKDDAKDIGKADVAGAIGGAAAGAAAAGVGAGPGAVAGAVTASFGTSVVKAVDAVLDWIW